MMNRSQLNLSPCSSPLASYKDKFEFPAPSDLWPSFSFPTPPTSPVEFCSNCQEVTKEMRWHAASGPWGELREISDEEIEVDDVPFEIARQFCGMRAESPAILNDIMWSGDRVRRPDSTTDFEARFSLSSTPTCFDQPISHTFVEPEELFSFSLLSHCSDQDVGMLDRLANGDAAFNIPSEDLPSETGIYFAQNIYSSSFCLLEEEEQRIKILSQSKSGKTPCCSKTWNVSSPICCCYFCLFALFYCIGFTVFYVTCPAEFWFHLFWFPFLKYTCVVTTNPCLFRTTK